MTYGIMFLMYVFGYVTCKTFYYLQASRLGILLVKTGSAFSLFLLTRALENYEVSRTLLLKDLKERNMSKDNLKVFENNLQEEIDLFKRKTISSLINSHQGFFEEILEYEDWETGMNFLEQNRDLIITAYSDPE